MQVNRGSRQVRMSEKLLHFGQIGAGADERARKEVAHQVAHQFHLAQQSQRPDL